MPCPRRGGLIALLAVGLLAAGVGCGNDNADRAGELTDARVDPTVSGPVTVTGSSTVLPVSMVAAEALRGQNPQVEVSVEGPGTGDGLQRFCEGGADVAGASRPIRDEELAACAAAGIEVIELPIGRDGIAVVVAPENRVGCLSFVDLYALLGPESDGVDRWREAGSLARQLHSAARFPDEALVVTGPGEESGTYDSFLEQVIDPVAEERVAAGRDLEVGTPRVDYAASADDNTVVEGVGAESGGLGWVSFTYAAQAEGVRSVPVSREPGGPCVAPTAGTVQDGSYPIARTLYLYVNAGTVEEDPAVAAFVDFYLAGLDDFVALSDYVPLADPRETVAVWEDRVTGSREAGRVAPG